MLKDMNKLKNFLELEPLFILFQKYIAIILSLVFFIGGAIIIWLSYFLNLGQYGMGIAFLCAPLGYYIIRNNRLFFSRSKHFEASDKDKVKYILLDISFYTIYIISILILYAITYYRPWYYFVFVAIGFTILLVQTFYIRYNFYHIGSFLCKLFLLSLTFRAGRFFAFPEIPGTDTHFHLRLAQIIHEVGFIPPHGTHYQYTYSALFHLFEAIHMIVLDVGLAASLFIMASGSLIALTLLLYAIGSYLFDFRVGLIAAVFVNIADMVFVKSVTNIETSLLVMVFFLVLIICFHHHEKRFYGIAALMIFCMFWTHQLSVFAVFLALTGYYLAYLIFNHTNIKKILSQSHSSSSDKTSQSLPQPNTLYMILFSAWMIFFWSLIGGDGSDAGFMGSMARRLWRTLDRMFSQYVETSDLRTSTYEKLFSGYELIDSVLYTLGSALLFCLALVGITYVLKKYYDQEKIGLILAVGILFFVIYPGTYIGLDQVFIPHRFIPFLQLVFISFSAFSLILLYQSLSTRPKRVLLSLFVLAMVFLLITTPYINRNDPIYGKNIEYRTEAMVSELQGISWGQKMDTDGKVIVDPRISKNQISTLEILYLDSNNISTYPNYGSLIYIREYIGQDPKLRLGGTFGVTREKDYTDYVTNIQINYQSVYHNGEVKNYLA